MSVAKKSINIFFIQCSEHENIKCGVMIDLHSIFSIINCTTIAMSKGTAIETEYQIKDNVFKAA